MSIETPDVIARYHAAAEARDWPALAACFTADGVVRDERQTYVGHAEIRAWREAVPWSYATTVGTTAQRPDGVYEVPVHLEGDFPGGVADVTWRFLLEDDLIAELEC
ncbi:MAG: nuclear transport factor 2 family protein [Solirubrobacteraceae bacterium]|nr:nuclear transport factor 2 family protein [Solirubrobacteraceae bacterium]